MTVDEARRDKVCRICGESAANAVAMTYNYGREYAHTSCVESITPTGPIPRPYFQCIVCDRQLYPDLHMAEDDDRRAPVMDGSHWKTVGNFGCTLYDGPFRHGGLHLEIVICDWCLLEKVSHIREYMEDGTTRPAEFSGVVGPGPKP